VLLFAKLLLVPPYIARRLIHGAGYSHSFATNLDGLGEPGCALSVGPLTLLLVPVLGRVLDSDTVLGVVLPLANVLVSIREGHCSVAVLLALLEVAIVLPSVLVGQLTLAFEQVLAEFAFVGSFRLSEVVDA